MHKCIPRYMHTYSHNHLPSKHRSRHCVHAHIYAYMHASVDAPAQEAPLEALQRSCVLVLGRAYLCHVCVHEECSIGRVLPYVCEHATIHAYIVLCTYQHQTHAHHDPCICMQLGPPASTRPRVRRLSMFFTFHDTHNTHMHVHVYIRMHTVHILHTSLVCPCVCTPWSAASAPPALAAGAAGSQSAQPSAWPATPSLPYRHPGHPAFVSCAITTRYAYMPGCLCQVPHPQGAGSRAGCLCQVPHPQGSQPLQLGLHVGMHVGI